MYKISNPYDVLGEGGVLVLVPFSTYRRYGIPSVPPSLLPIIPGAKKALEKIASSTGARDTFYYLSNLNTYIFHRVSTSSKSSSVSMEMLNSGLDKLEEFLDSHKSVLILPTGDVEADKYLKLLFKGHNSLFFLED